MPANSKDYIKKPILTALTFAMVLLTAIFLFGSYRAAHHHLFDMTSAKLRSVERLLQVQISSNIELMGNLIQPLQYDNQLKEAFIAKDRTRLLSLSQPKFNELFAAHRVGDP